ncbi:Cytochrome b6 [Streptomyces avidinii]
MRKAFPDHWSFLLGEIALYSLLVLLLTGTWLTFFFQPSMQDTVYAGPYAPLRGQQVSEAFASTLRLSFEVRGGLLIRQMHHWAALLFVFAIGAHLLRVFLTGAFRRPREANWVVGVTMLLLALVEGFAGYSLPDDLLSGTGLRTAQGIMLSVPVAGTYLSFFAFGGEYPGQDIVARLYPVHILLVPGLLVGLVSLHLLLVVHLKHTQWAGPGRTGRNVVGKPLFPHYTAKSAGLFFLTSAVLAALGALAQINPVWAYGPYRTDVVSTGAQPDWYVGFLEGALRLMPGVETRLWGHALMWNPLVPGVLLPGLLFAGLYGYPFFERWITGSHGERHVCDRPRNRPARTALGVAVLTSYVVLLLAGAQDIIAFITEISVQALTWTLRCAVVLLPPLAFWLTRRLCPRSPGPRCRAAGARGGERRGARERGRRLLGRARTAARRAAVRQCRVRGEHPAAPAVGRICLGAGDMAGPSARCPQPLVLRRPVAVPAQHGGPPAGTGHDRRTGRARPRAGGPDLRGPGSAVRTARAEDEPEHPGRKDAEADQGQPQPLHHSEPDQGGPRRRDHGGVTACGEEEAAVPASGDLRRPVVLGPPPVAGELPPHEGGDEGGHQERDHERGDARRIVRQRRVDASGQREEHRDPGEQPGFRPHRGLTSGWCRSNAGESVRIRGSAWKLCRGGGQPVAHSRERPQPHGSSDVTRTPMRAVRQTL